MKSNEKNKCLNPFKSDKTEQINIYLKYWKDVNNMSLKCH